MKKIFFLLAVAVTFLFPPSGFAELDWVQLELLKQYPLPLRWDNVKSCPEWVSGTRPSWHLGEGMDRVTLEPGREISVLIPPYERLRLTVPENEIHREDLEISLSRGAGLYAAPPVQAGVRNRSLLVSPQSRVPLLARIKRPSRHKEAIEVALFLSRHDPLGEIAPYRGCVDLPGETVRISRRDRPGAVSFRHFKPNVPITFQVRGPARILFENRFLYPPREPARIQTYRLFAHMEGNPAQILDFETVPETARAVFVDGDPRVVGTPKRGYLNIPEGDQRVRVFATGDIYGRFLIQETPDYLIPGANAPDPDAMAVRKKGFPEILKQSPWDLTTREIQDVCNNPERSPAELERVAWRLVRDNGRREGGLLGTMLMWKAGLDRPDDPRIRREARLLYGDHTFYRNLLPATKGARAPQEFSWFISRSLLKPVDRGRNLVVAEQHLEGLIKGGLSGAYFNHLPSIFLLPERFSPGFLRVVVDDAFLGSQEFFLQMDQHAPVKFKTQKGTEFSRQDFYPSLGEAGLDLFWLHEPHWTQPSLGGPFSTRFTPAPLVNAGTSVLPLPPGVRRIKIWKSSPGPGKLRIALQYRASKPYRLSEGAYLEAVRQASKTRGIYDLFLEKLIDFRENEPEKTHVRTTPPDKPGRVFGVQTGAFGQAKNIRAMKDRLQNAGYPAFERSVPAQGGQTLTAVLAGPFNTPREAKATLEALSLKGIEGLLREVNTTSPAPTGSETLAARELENNWLPLFRLLRSRAMTFQTGLGPEAPAWEQTNPISPKEVHDLVSKAETAEEKGQWLVAMETWTRLFRGGPVPLKDRALFSRIRALENLGEHFLAETLLRGILIHGNRSAIRLKAFQRLAEKYGREQNQDALFRLYCYEILHRPTVGNIRTLATMLVDNGQTHMGMMLALALPRGEQPVWTLLRASLKEGWWKVFQEGLERVQGETGYHYWAAYAATGKGDYDEARVQFLKAGPRGETLARRLDQGLSIRVRLRSHKPEEREQSIMDWEQWQENQPGPHIWQDGSHLVTDYGGGESLYNPSRDLYSHFFRADPTLPVKVRILGPAHIRVDVRPLHDPGTTEPLNGWLEIREKENLYPFPLNNNLPAEGLRVVGNSPLLPGRNLSAVHPLGPGLHELEISTGGVSSLIRVFEQVPQLPLGVLPPLTPRTLVAAVAPDPDRTDGAPLGKTVRNIPHPRTGIPCLCRSCITVLPRDEKALPISFNRFDFPPFTASKTPTGKDLEPLMESLRALRKPLQKSDRNRARARYLGRGETEKALDLATDTTPEGLKDRMTLMLRLAEENPEMRPLLVARGRMLFLKHPLVPGLKPILNRMGGNSRWMQLPSVASSAGVRQLAVAGWQPESPALRVRKTLLAPSGKKEKIVAGDESLVLYLFNLAPTEVKISLGLEDISHLQPQPMTVLCHLADTPLPPVILTRDHPDRSLNITVPVGEHTFRIRIEKRVPNQFLRVGAWESPAQEIHFLESRDRLYHVATRDEPVAVQMDGPALLRVDEWRDGETLTRYRMVETGLQNLAFSPGPRQKESLFRLFKLESYPKKPVETVREARAEQFPVKGPLIRIADTPEAKQVRFKDDFPLGGQEEGTWSFTGLLARRRNFQEDREVEKNPEDFFQLSATNRYFNEHLNSHNNLEMLGRIRRHGGPTAGLREQFYYRPKWMPVLLSLGGQLFMQRPESIHSGPLEWSTLFRGSISQKRPIGPKTYHIPALSIFGRILSMNQNTRYSPEDLDQDIFTPYKADHKSGMVIRDVIKHRPWLDTLWYGAGSLASNSNFNLIKPDHFRIGVGWKQLIGEFTVNVIYRFNYFFADSDRKNSITRQIPGLDLTWNHWFKNQHRLEAGFSISRDLESGEESGMLFITWHMGNGRGYRDYLPREVDFLDIRTREIPQERNNEIQDVEN